MGKYKLTYKPFGSHSILIEWPQKIDKNILNDVIFYKNELKKHYIKEKVYINNAYNSLLISYDNNIENIYNEFSSLKSIYSGHIDDNPNAHKCWKMPVCYDSVFGLDLDIISTQNNLSNQDIIRLHSETIYTVYFLGFLPGFLYLGGLDEKLYFPRKAIPRLKVEKGSVAIGGNQTGIYPCESPGGWNIIGNSPVNLFDMSKEIPCFAKAGDKIQFVPVSLEQHIDIMILVESGVYQIESEVIHD